MKKTWHHTSDTSLGHSITVDVSGLEWVRYTLPLTNFSGGSSMHYKLEEITPQSSLALEIMKVFGENVFASINAYVHELVQQKSTNIEEKPVGIENESMSNMEKERNNSITEHEFLLNKWNEADPNYLDRFGIMAFESSTGVLQLIEKQSGTPLTLIQGKFLEILSFPFQHLVVVATPKSFRLVSGNSNPKTILEPLETEEFKGVVSRLFPPTEKDNIIHLPFQNLENEYNVLHISMQGKIVGKTKIQ